MPKMPPPSRSGGIYSGTIEDNDLGDGMISASLNLVAERLRRDWAEMAREKAAANTLSSAEAISTCP